MRVIQDIVLRGDARETTLYLEGILRILGCICVRRVIDYAGLILYESHYSRYSINFSSMKMYCYLRPYY